MNITRSVLKRPVTTVMVVLCLIVFGLTSVLSAKLELTPTMEMPMLVIFTLYPGASPDDVNELVTQPIEDETGTLTGMKGITSVSSENVSIVLVEYEYGIDIDEAYDDLKKKMDVLEMTLPDDVESPTIIEMNIIFILARYMFLGFIVMRLRKMYPVENRPADMYVIGGGKVGVRLYSALAFGIATFTLCLHPVANFFATVVFLASGVVAYIVFKKIYGGLAKENPSAHPIDPKTGLAVGDTRRIGLFALIIVGLFALNVLMNLLFLG